MIGKVFCFESLFLQQIGMLNVLMFEEMNENSVIYHFWNFITKTKENMSIWMMK